MAYYEKGQIAAAAQCSGQILGTGTQYEGYQSAAGLGTKDVRAVQQALARLHSAKNDVRMCLDSMAQRIDPLMTPLGPEKASGSACSDPMPQAGALFVEISGVAADLESAAQAMRSYMQRLEV